MAEAIERLIGKKINGTRVVPLVMKIVVFFTVFLLVSNLATNFINLMLNRGELRRQANNLLVKDLKELYTFGLNQYEIYRFSGDLPGALRNLGQAGMDQLAGQRSVALGIKPDGELLFQASRLPREERFGDERALAEIGESQKAGQKQGTLRFRFAGKEYFGVFRFHDQWNAFFLRGEELQEFNAESMRSFRSVTFIILLITVLCVLVGAYLNSYILRYVRVITYSIMQMQKRQQIELVDLKGAPNDDVTYLGIAFNSLASTINNLVTIFRKFVVRDLAAKAYKEGEIRLEGEKRELAILFTDIKSFTNMTETLGTDIIKLLNMHYSRAIRSIHEHDGDVGSIIGDALLALFGHLGNGGGSKSLQALRVAYDIQEVAASLRTEMTRRREEIIRVRGGLTEEEEKVYRAVMLEVGVGIDGGEVFYGTIGSADRMTATVIGDNVNSASRLEGLTRLYKVPVIVSEYVKKDVEREGGGYYFLELDTVQVKGKTLGVKVYWPIAENHLSPDLRESIDAFSEGLREYYAGDWKKALRLFKKSGLPVAEIFVRRTTDTACPKDWNGIWTMKEK